MKTRAVPHPLSAVCLPIMLAVALWPRSGHAQDETTFVQPAPEQIDLIRKGVRASDQGEYAQAIRYYQAALALGDLNLAHINLGRAYQKNNDCQRADKHYGLALTAPAAREPAPKVVREAIEGYRQEMVEVCPGQLIVECQPTPMELEVDGERAQCGEPIALVPGAHAVIARAYGQQKSLRVSIEGLEIRRVEMAFQEPPLMEEPIAEMPTEIEPAPVEPEPVEPQKDASATLQPAIERPTPAPTPKTMSASAVTGWSLIAFGGGALVAGAVMGLKVDQTNTRIEALAAKDRFDPDKADALLSDAQTFSQLELAGLGLGAAGLLAGAALIWWDGGTEQSPPSALRWFPIAGRDGFGAGLELRH